MRCSTLSTTFFVLILGTVLGGCSTFGASGESSPMASYSERFSKPDTSAKAAAKELGQRLDVFQRELNCAREQLTVLNATQMTIEDPQLPGAIQVLEQRVSHLEVAVAEIARRQERAATAASSGSLEDFSMAVLEAPEPPHDATEDPRSVLNELQGTYTQLRREIDALALHISNAEIERERRSNESRSLSMALEIDSAKMDAYREELLKTEWRVAIAQCAVTHKSKLDLSPLLTQPEMTGDDGLKAAYRN